MVIWGALCISLDFFHQSVITKTWDCWIIHYFSEKCAVLPFLQRQHRSQLYSPRLPGARYGAGLRKGIYTLKPMSGSCWVPVMWRQTGTLGWLPHGVWGCAGQTPSVCAAWHPSAMKPESSLWLWLIWRKNIFKKMQQQLWESSILDIDIGTF